jgi:DNA ligase 4
VIRSGIVALRIDHNSRPFFCFNRTQHSLISNASDEGTRNLALVFFDILLIDNVSLLGRRYSERRALLEDIIAVKEGYAMIAERECISAPISSPSSFPSHLLDKRVAPTSNIEGAEDQLARVFARIISAHEEGLVLKADDGTYNSWSSPWVKVGSCWREGRNISLIWRNSSKRIIFRATVTA